MTDDYSTISDAARHRDWQGCDRLMFRELYLLPFECQREIAVNALCMYMEVWARKHPHSVPIKEWIARSSEAHSLPKVPDSEKLDPADAEFENGLMQFSNALTTQSPSQHTTHFATSIRSAVLARQINRWLHDSPMKYESWKRGEFFPGPTFLDDEAASVEAEKAWHQIDKWLQKSSRLKRRRTVLAAADFEREYTAWENSLL